jgi:hypothetical protein
VVTNTPLPFSASLNRRADLDWILRGWQINSAIVAFAAFIGRSPDMATAEDLRLFQLHQTQSGMQPPSGQTNLIYPLGAINVERWRTPLLIAGGVVILAFWRW